MTCRYCEGIERHRVCRTHLDGCGTAAELVWFDGDEWPTLAVNGEDGWASTWVSNCPWCGQDLVRR